jgi:hypothetical protein
MTPMTRDVARFRGLYLPAMRAAGSADKTRTTAKRSGVDPRKLAEVFRALCELLSPYERDLAVQIDTPGYYCLESRTPTYRNRPMYFAGVRVGKNYVSYHLMSVYACPELVKVMSPELKKRMQGKSCFNFTTIDRELFAELDRLTRAGYERFKSMKYL